MQQRRERTQRALLGSTSSLVETKKMCASKNLDKTARLQSEKKEEWISEERGEKLQGIAEGRSSAPRLDKSLAASFSAEFADTHCSLIVRRREKTIPARCARAFEVRGKMDKRTEW